MTEQPRPPWAARLQAERETRNWGTWETARRLYAAAGITGGNIRSLARQISRHETGAVFPTDWAPHYATAYGIPIEDLFGSDPSPGAFSFYEFRAEAGDDVRRRELLQLGALGAIPGSNSDLVRQSLDHVLGLAETNRAEDWDLAYMDHAHSILTLPPAQAHQALILDLAALHQQLSRDRHDLDLQRAAAQLSALSGNVLTRMGNYNDARRWWATARHAADASGDVSLSAWVRGVEAAFALYAPRPLQSVVALATTARDKAGNRPSLGLLCAMGVQAQALATLGRSDDSRRVLNELTESEARTDDKDGYGWTRDSLAYVTSWVLAYTGEPDEGSDARAEVMRLSQSYQNVANARLHEAIAVARRGGHAEAARTASEVIGEIEPPYRTRMIVRTGQRVIDAVPAEHRQGGPMREFRALLTASGSGHQDNGST